MEHGGSQGSTICDLVEFLGTKVINEDMEGQHVFNGVDREVFGEEGCHGGIVHGEDSDGETAVDL